MTVPQITVKLLQVQHADALGHPVSRADSHGKMAQTGHVGDAHALQPLARVVLLPSLFPAAPVPPQSDPRSDYTLVRPEPGELYRHHHLPAVVLLQAPCIVLNGLVQ